ncbi:hypothetical protein ACUSIJ_25920 [Pseudochelatococcus sp. B33]
MIAPQVLSAAVERGILRPEQATALTELAAELAAGERTAAEPVPDDEKLRFISGFNDIFVSIGIGLFLGAVILLFGENVGDIAACAAVATSSWALAELFSRRRRMALPSILLLAAFAGSVLLGLIWWLSPLIGDAARAGVLSLDPFVEETPAVVVAAALLTFAAVALHYWRFRVPITIAAGAGTLALAGIAAVLLVAPEWGFAHLTGLLLAGGLMVFALAAHFDLGDLTRTSRRTDIAFWLHLLAASMIIHPIVTVVVGDISLDRLDREAALMILATLAVLSLVALAIDRRAILSAGLIYAGFAFYALIENADFSSSTFGLAVLALGAYVLAISALWRPLRNGLLRLLPDSVVHRLPRPVLSRADSFQSTVAR